MSNYYYQGKKKSKMIESTQISKSNVPLDERPNLFTFICAFQNIQFMFWNAKASPKWHPSEMRLV